MQVWLAPSFVFDTGTYLSLVAEEDLTEIENVVPNLNRPDITKDIPASENVPVTSAELHHLQSIVKEHRTKTVTQLQQTQHIQTINPDHLDPSPLQPDYELKKRHLGGGGFGFVFKASWLDQDVTVKKIKLAGQATPQQMNDFKKEAAIMSGWHQPNIVRVYGVVARPDCCCLVMEFLPISLQTKLSMTYATTVTVSDETKTPLGKIGDEVFPVSLRLHLLKGVLSGLQFLHSNGIAHRDLKPANVLLAENWMPRLIDFGLSEFTRQRQGAAGECTLPYMAPELFGSDEVDAFRADVYAFGMLLYETLFLRPPFYELQNNQLALKQFIPHGRKPALPGDTSEVPSWAMDVMKQCWDTEAQRRPPIESIRQAFQNHASAAQIPKTSPVEMVRSTPFCDQAHISHCFRIIRSFVRCLRF
jgi:serine/threonine protein kinase